MGLACGRSNDSVDVIRFFNSTGALEILQRHNVKLVLGQEIAVIPGAGSANLTNVKQ